MRDPMMVGTGRFVRLGAVVAAAVLALAACSGGATSAPTNGPSVEASSALSSAPSASSAGGSSVKVIDFGFDPTSITVKAGSSVTWTNTGSATHTVTADDASFDSGNFASGATFSQTFAKAGTFAYHCKIHASMHGTVIVTP
jgi:plastocyanin